MGSEVFESQRPRSLTSSRPGVEIEPQESLEAEEGGTSKSNSAASPSSKNEEEVPAGASPKSGQEERSETSSEEELSLSLEESILLPPPPLPPGTEAETETESGDNADENDEPSDNVASPSEVVNSDGTENLDSASRKSGQGKNEDRDVDSVENSNGHELDESSATSEKEEQTPDDGAPPQKDKDDKGGSDTDGEPADDTKKKTDPPIPPGEPERPSDEIDKKHDDKGGKAKSPEDKKPQENADGGKATAEEEYRDEIQAEEREFRRVGGLGIFLAVLAMIFTAWQMSENPDGIYAAACRLIITVIGLIFRLALSPCRSCIGSRFQHVGNINPRHSYGQIPVSTMDYGYRDPSLELS